MKVNNLRYSWKIVHINPTSFVVQNILPVDNKHDDDDESDDDKCRNNASNNC